MHNVVAALRDKAPLVWLIDQLEVAERGTERFKERFAALLPLVCGRLEYLLRKVGFDDGKAELEGCREVPRQPAAARKRHLVKRLLFFNG